MQVHDKLYIDGAWVPSTGSGTIDVHDSTNGEVIARVPEGTADDVDAAARAARAAFESLVADLAGGAGQVLAPASPRAWAPAWTRSPPSSPARRACPSG